MNTKYTKNYADKILDQLVELDLSTNAGYYEMGRLLSAISKNTLWDIIGYESLGQMISEELSFAPGTATHYITLYDNLRRLKYNKAESLKLIQKHSMTRLIEVLPKMGTKVSDRAVANRIAASEVNQLNFIVNNKELGEVQEALTRLGVTTEEKSGRRKHSSEAFMIMIRDVNSKPALKAVA